MTEPTIDERVAGYLAVRDKIKEMEERHAQEKLELIKYRDYLEKKLSEFMTANNLDNIKTAVGTAHWNTRRTASLADPDAFMQFVIANQQFDLLDRKANSAAVTQYVEKHNMLPPGCNLNTIQTVGVRRPSGK